VRLDKEKLEHLLTLREDPRWNQLSDFLEDRLRRKEDRLIEKPLYDGKEVASFNVLIGEIKEIRNILDLDNFIRNVLNHNEE
tara:strand:- start:208 stop:453 length:246 start_codon:yes stop_codon:yes gene_type:complete